MPLVANKVIWESYMAWRKRNRTNAHIIVQKQLEGNVLHRIGWASIHVQLPVF